MVSAVSMLRREGSLISLKNCYMYMYQHFNSLSNVMRGVKVFNINWKTHSRPYIFTPILFLITYTFKKGELRHGLSLCKPYQAIKIIQRFHSQIPCYKHSKVYFEPRCERRGSERGRDIPPPFSMAVKSIFKIHFTILITTLNKNINS